MSVLSEKVYLLEYKERMKEREKEKIKKEMEEIQKKKQQQAEQKQYEKDIFLACKRDLKARFEEDFKLQGLKAKYNFYNIATRDMIIKSLAETEAQGDYLEANYNKILNEVIKKYELQEQYKEQRNLEIAQEEIEKMTPIWEEQAKKEKRKNIINAIFTAICLTIKWLFIILFGGIVLLFKFISTLAK